ncbi:MAG: hypothetical protein QM651_06730 [Rhodoblastus sp.]
MQIETLPLAGLTAPSLVRPIKIACIERGRIVRKAGQLAQRRMTILPAAIRSFVG